MDSQERRGEEEGVKSEADGVVDGARGGEGAVAAFVGEDSEVNLYKPLDESMSHKERIAETRKGSLAGEIRNFGVQVELRVE